MRQLYFLSLVLALAFLVYTTSEALAGLDTIESDALHLPSTEETIDEKSIDYVDSYETKKEEKSAGLPQLDPTWFPSQVFWILITFFTMLAIFSLKILPNMTNTLEKRHNHIQNDLDIAEDLKEQTEIARVTYEELLHDANQKAMELMTNLDESLKKKSADAVEKFRTKSQDMVTETEAAIVKDKKAAMKDMHKIVAEVASLAANKIVGISPDADEAEAVVQKIHKKAA